MAHKNRNPRWDKAVQAILETGSITKAAEQTRISRRSLTRWLALREFQRELSAARQRAFALAMGKLSYFASDAAAVVLYGLTKESVSGRRLRAARTVLSTVLRCQALDLDARLDEIEERIDQLLKETPSL
jgi:hypothetical protein